MSSDYNAFDAFVDGLNTPPSDPWGAFYVRLFEDYEPSGIEELDDIREWERQWSIKNNPNGIAWTPQMFRRFGEDYRAYFRPGGEYYHHRAARRLAHLRPESEQPQGHEPLFVAPLPRYEE